MTTNQILTQCTHPTVRALNGGVCPICPTPAADVVSSGCHPPGWGGAGGAADCEMRGENTPALKIGSESGKKSTGASKNAPKKIVPEKSGAAVLASKPAKLRGNDFPPIDRATLLAQRAALAEELRRMRTLTDKNSGARAAKASLARFVRTGWHVIEPRATIRWSWHIDVICDHVQWILEDWARAQAIEAQLERGDITPETAARFRQRAQNAVINVPPGSLKSRILSVYAPAWAWLHWPHFRVLCITANPDIGSRDSVFCRQVIESDWYQTWFEPPWQMSEDQNTKLKYRNTMGGERTSLGIGSNIVGSRADALFVDDPNSPKDSAEVRHQRNEDWTSTIDNRVNSPTSVRVLIQQRTAEDDLTGHVLAGEGATGWLHVRIPMEFDAKPDCRCGTCVGTNVFGWRDPRSVDGELLHPERWDADFCSKERAKGSFRWAGQYQQRPAPAGGGLFRDEWWREFDPGALPTFDELVLSCDLTFGSKTITADSCSLLVVARQGAYRYVLDNVTRKMDATQQVAAIKELLARHQQIGKVLIEKAANGQAVIDLLTKEHNIAGVVGIPPTLFGGDKVSRALACQPQVEASNVLLPKGAPWLDEFRYELGVFPNGKHDDQVDAMTMALNYMRANATWDAFKR